MSVFEAGKKPVHIPTVAREVFDVTGAGDTVIAVAALALISGATILEAAALSNAAAGIVVGKIGTAAVTPGELYVGPGPALTAHAASRCAALPAIMNSEHVRSHRDLGQRPYRP